MAIDAKFKEVETKRRELVALKTRFKELKQLNEDEMKLKEEAFFREIEEIKLLKEDLAKD